MNSDFNRKEVNRATWFTVLVVLILTGLFIASFLAGVH
jgi:hypothetical protein